MPKVTLAMKFKEQSVMTNVPGPGNYDLSTANAQRSAPKYGFGTSQRIGARDEGTPGPGSYKVPSRVADVP
jgi:hypothetical protein